MEGYQKTHELLMRCPYGDDVEGNESCIWTCRRLVQSVWYGLVTWSYTGLQDTALCQLVTYFPIASMLSNPVTGSLQGFKLVEFTYSNSHWYIIGGISTLILAVRREIKKFAKRPNTRAGSGKSSSCGELMHWYIETLPELSMLNVSCRKEAYFRSEHL